METVKIYLSGGMGNLNFEEQSKWRKQVINAILFGDYHWEKKPIFFNPVDYYNLTDVRYKTEREVVEFDLNALRNSDLVIVNFNDPKSLGTCAELAIAYEMRIPVIGINKDKHKLHPWLAEFTTRMCDDIREAVSHVVEFYLN
jgi:nucleoside 2-deoxyribosyltransferase